MSPIGHSTALPSEPVLSRTRFRYPCCSRSWIHDRPTGRWLGQQVAQPSQLLVADAAGRLSRNQAVQRDHTQARQDADSRALVGTAAEQAQVAAVGVELPAAERARERHPVVMVAGAIRLPGLALPREAADQGLNGAVALRRPVVRDVAADDDKVDAAQMSAVLEELSDRDSRIKAVLVRAKATRYHFAGPLGHSWATTGVLALLCVDASVT